MTYWYPQSYLVSLWRLALIIVSCNEVCLQSMICPTLTRTTVLLQDSSVPSIHPSIHPSILSKQLKSFKTCCLCSGPRKKSYNFDRTKGEREARYMRPLPQKRKEHRNGEMVFLHSSECSQAIISAKAFQQLLFKDFKFQCVTEFLHQLVYFTTKIMARPVFFVAKACTVVNFTPG